MKERGRMARQGGYISGKWPMTVQFGTAAENSAAIGSLAHQSYSVACTANKNRVLKIDCNREVQLISLFSFVSGS